uniref:Uncharacterized protein n=1 Tax=Melanopsichium pennsylvanicum 4 TaxID=1398559 RepID=A0A077R690_9BASI|nr:uncharacterized protein BN887_06172 [Melanopsichium pennsylvanicum 4]
MCLLAVMSPSSLNGQDTFASATIQIKPLSIYVFAPMILVELTTAAAKRIGEDD